MWFLNLKLVLNKGVHPQYMIILPLKLQLITNQIRQLPLRLHLQLVQHFFEECINLFLHMRRLRVDLFDFEVYLGEILGELVLPTFDVGIDLFDL